MGTWTLRETSKTRTLAVPFNRALVVRGYLGMLGGGGGLGKFRAFRV